MTPKEMKELAPGDIVTGAMGQAYIVTANYGNRVTAVRTADLTNPDEWCLARRAGNLDYPEITNYQALAAQVSSETSMSTNGAKALFEFCEAKKLPTTKAYVLSLVRQAAGNGDSPFAIAQATARTLLTPEGVVADEPAFMPSRKATSAGPSRDDKPVGGPS